MTESQKEMLYKLIGNNVYRYITQVKSIKQVDLAGKIGVSRATLSNVLKGKRQTNIHLLVDIARELNVELTTLIPSLTEINSTFSEIENKVEQQFTKNEISDSDKATILNLIK